MIFAALMLAPGPSPGSAASTPTNTPLPTSTPTATPLPTNPPVLTPTNSPVPPTGTPPTNTPAPTPTNTPVPPTDSPPPTNTPVPTPTNTPVLTTFTVNSVNDVDDGICDAAHCSLREAINAANANLGTDTIEFNISGVGPHTIQPLSALPTITDPVIIDGYTQPGASPNSNGPGLGSNAVLKIELDGTRAPPGTFSAHGLHITAGNSSVRGLVINRFIFHGIFLETNGGNLIEGNFIGTDVTGTVGLGNARSGVFISFGASNNIIGGTSAGARNVISGNSTGTGNSAGISIGPGAGGNLIQGNFIGTDVTGTEALGNRFGVRIAAVPKNIIGGTTVAARNIISNNVIGVLIESGGATRNLVQGNFIGIDVTGTEALGNRFGVFIRFGASDNTIGGVASGASNIIAFNGSGVSVESGTGNSILSNSIFSNTNLGIDLVPLGVTPSDAGDADTGPNNLQNFPVLTSAISGGSTTVEGTLNSTANTTFTLQFFSNTACDPSGHGEGETFLGSTDVTTDGGGNASFTLNFATTVPAGQFITATATDPNNNTSEFSQCIPVVETVVEIDIKPKSDPNVIKVDRTADIPVAILSTLDFDATTVDPLSVEFGPDGAREAHDQGHLQDVDGDGDPDMVLHFPTQETGITLEDTEACLTGQTTDGIFFQGCGSIQTKAKAPAQVLAFVINRGGRLTPSVAVVDTTTLRIVQEIDLEIEGKPSRPSTLALTPDGKLLYVPIPGKDEIKVIDVRTRSVVQTITVAEGVGDGPKGIVITPDGKFAYVAHIREATVRVLDLSTNTFITTITSPFIVTPQEVAITPDGSHVYIANTAFTRNPVFRSRPENVTVIETATNTVVAGVDVSGLVKIFGPWGVTALPDRKKVYSNDGDDGEFVFEIDSDPSSVTFNQVTDVIRIGDTSNGPRGMDSGVTPVGVRVYVALADSGEVVVIDPATNQVVARIPTGLLHDTLRVRLNPDGTELWVSNRETDQVVILDTVSNTILARISGFNEPSQIAFLPTAKKDK